MKKYLTGSDTPTRIDDGLLALVRNYKDESGLPMKYIIEKAIYDKMVKLGLAKKEQPSGKITVTSTIPIKKQKK
jgi:hypothetical protein